MYIKLCGWKIYTFFAFKISQSLRYCVRSSMREWVVHNIKVGVLYSKPDDKDLIRIQNIADKTKTLSAAPMVAKM